MKSCESKNLQCFSGRRHRINKSMSTLKSSWISLNLFTTSLEAWPSLQVLVTSELLTGLCYQLKSASPSDATRQLDPAIGIFVFSELSSSWHMAGFFNFGAFYVLGTLSAESLHFHTEFHTFFTLHLGKLRVIGHSRLSAQITIYNFTMTFH